MMPARSYTLLRISASVSSSRTSIPNLARSGLKVTLVQLSEGLQAVILGASLTDMLERNT